MVQSLRRLLDESIDFSGLTGPQNMSVDEALERYLRYRAGSENWILSRLVCPVKNLKELADRLDEIELDSPLPVAVVGAPTSSPATWEDELAACAEAMNEFDSETPDFVEVAAFEIRPPAAMRPDEVLRDLKGFSEVDVFVESSRSVPEGLVEAIAESDWAFLKVDLSGTSRPDSFTIAKLIHEAIALELPFKIVQGSGRSVTNGAEFGLVNLFGAVAVGLSEDLSSRELEAVLTDGEWTHWQFDQNSISFRGWEADGEAIDQARDVLLDAECFSVEYAMDDLATLGFAVREGG
jgi:hypothetical protein